MFITYLLLGSNLGDSLKFLEDARAMIEENIGVIIQSSALYRTASWGKAGQPDFINQVLEVNTHLMPENLLVEVLAVEQKLGRERSEKWGSRVIDIDILLFDDQIVSTSSLTIPHAHLHERRFCLEPLSSIAPTIMHPVLKKSITELLDELSDDLFVKKLS